MGMEIAGEACQHATVVVASRNRPEMLDRCLRALLVALPPGSEIVCVDQSDAGSTLGGVPRSPALRYLRSERRGVCAGRNQGAEAARAGLLIFTDDDCIVPPRWVESWLELFDRLPTVDLGFGSVRARDAGRRDGFTPEFHPPVTAVQGLGIFRRGPSALGIGANMALRRSAWHRVGGFDEALGAGARYPGAEETDIAYRLVRSGSRLVQHAGPAVIHDGFRGHGEAARLSMRYSAGAGAMYMKHVRCGDPYALQLAALESWRMLGAPAAALLRGRRPAGTRALLGYCLGAISSMRVEIDRSERRYRRSLPERRTTVDERPRPGPRAADPGVEPGLWEAAQR